MSGTRKYRGMTDQERKAAYGRMLEVYREGGTQDEARLRAGVSRHIAAAYWERGVLDLNLPGIREVLRNERSQAAREAKRQESLTPEAKAAEKALLERMRPKVEPAPAPLPDDPEEAGEAGGDFDPELAMGPSRRDLLAARQSHIEAVAQEMQMVKLARGGALGLLAIQLHLVNASRKLARDLEARILDPRDDREKLTYQQAMAFLDQTARVGGRAVAMARDVIDAQRALLGIGDEGAGGPSAIADTMSAEEAVAELREAQRIYADMVASGKLIVLSDHQKPAAEPTPVPEADSAPDETAAS